ncbi:hypothetical protein ETD83_29760 [Actinomadura soli]|uniref:Chromosome segregation ATPase n=1 Tax=Actinomadura soli TaxID=2508997 RepID=A0A5C4J4L3_9ACTN|nr:hypothetical protein [Actinomadura soli]TMQ91689.1 hypothetical protein ETD83_29760 [Actinomadura soli]
MSSEDIAAAGSGVPEADQRPGRQEVLGEPVASPGAMPEDGPARPGGECALAGCTQPLPPPGRGRPAKYCGKAHADQASRDRRAADAAAVDEPLRRAEALAGRLPDAIGGLQEQLTALTEALAQAQSGALARVQRAEAEAVAARQAEADADARAAEADRARARADADAVDAVRARRAAEQEAERDRAALERVRADAAETVAAHAQLRDAAREGQAAAEAARDAKVAELRETRQAHEQDLARRDAAARAEAGRLDAARADLTRTIDALTAAREALATAGGEARAERARAEAAEHARDVALDRRVQDLQAAADLAAGEAADARASLAACQAVSDRLETALSAARAEAAEQRERAARAEAAAVAAQRLGDDRRNQDDRSAPQPEDPPGGARQPT